MPKRSVGRRWSDPEAAQRLEGGGGACVYFEEGEGMSTAVQYQLVFVQR